MNYKDFLKDRKIAVIGLGPHGEMFADIKFLLMNKAQISLYDMRSEKRLKGLLPKLKKAGLSKYSFGKINDEDLLSAELILLSPEISKKSLFLKKASMIPIQIEYAETLFWKLAPPVTFIGVMGIYGKSIVAYLIYSMLRKSFADYEEQGLFFIDPDSANGALNHLKKIKKDDVVLARITAELLPHYCKIHISPHVAVITSIIPFDILKSQTYNNFVVAPDAVIDEIKLREDLPSKAKMLRTRGSLVPDNWQLSMRTKFFLEDAALAREACTLFKVSTDIVRDILQKFSGLKGRVEFVKKVNGTEFYNDANSVTPQATIAALQSLSSSKIVLILGGAYTGYIYDDLVKNIAESVSTVILVPGSGSLCIRSSIESLPEINFIQVFSLEEAVKTALESAKKDEKILFSPSFDAIGIDISRKERGERFVRAVRSL